MTIGQTVADKRRDLGKTAIVVARELGYNYPNYIYMMESEATKIPLEKIEKFAHVLGMTKAERAKFTRQVLKEQRPSLFRLFKDAFGIQEVRTRKIVTISKKR